MTLKELLHRWKTAENKVERLCEFNPDSEQCRQAQAEYKKYYRLYLEAILNEEIINE